MFKISRVVPYHWFTLPENCWSTPAGLLATTSIEHPDLERYGWLPYSCINALIGLLGFKLQRSLPVLMSAMALAVVSVRVSLFVSDVMESTVAGEDLQDINVKV